MCVCVYVNVCVCVYVNVCVCEYVHGKGRKFYQLNMYELGCYLDLHAQGNPNGSPIIDTVSQKG